ncbi:hypothetical protein ACK3BE_33370 (plasmid) [Pseudomonas mandelii]|uniref:hypothetical protein n=1 Tax=Pseudomonas mandelii TaxID=75612 RepID=UPI00398D25A5
MRNFMIIICNVLFNLVNPHSSVPMTANRIAVGADPFNPATGQQMVDLLDSTGAVYGYDAP